MAQYRKGNRFLSEEEYMKEQDDSWAGWLFIIGLLTAGYFSYKGIVGFEIEKWLRFTIVIISGIIGGTILAMFRSQIQIAAGIAVAAGVIYFIGSLLWSYV